MISAKGYVQALGFSTLHVSFTPAHEAYSPLPQVINAPDPYADFELVMLYQLVNGEESTAALPSSLSTAALDVVQWLLDNSTNGTLTVDTAASNSAASIAFSDNEYGIVLGTCRQDSANHVLPEKLTLTVGDDTLELWLLGSALEAQYTPRVYRVVPIIPTTDDMVVSSKAGLQSLASSYLANPYPAISTLMAAAPATGVVPLSTIWHNKDIESETLDLTFTMLVYGPGSPLVDEQRDALRNFLLDGSAYTASIWQDVFPGIFNISKFIVIPAYDQVIDGVIPTRWTAVTNPSVVLDKFKDDRLSLDDSWIAANYAFFPTTYQSIPTLVVPDMDNGSDRLSLTDFFDDYIVASTEDPSFITMSPATRNMVSLLGNTLALASGDSTTPVTGVTEEFVGGLRFQTFTVSDCQFLVATKATYDALTGS